MQLLWKIIGIDNCLFNRNYNQIIAIQSTKEEKKREMICENRRCNTIIILMSHDSSQNIINHAFVPPFSKYPTIIIIHHYLSTNQSHPKFLNTSKFI